MTRRVPVWDKELSLRVLTQKNQGVPKGQCFVQRGSSRRTGAFSGSDWLSSCPSDWLGTSRAVIGRLAAGEADRFAVVGGEARACAERRQLLPEVHG